MMMRGPNLFQNALLLLLALMATQARAELSQKQARKLITNMAGLSLPSKAVHVGQVRAISPAVVETSAEIEMVFRLIQNEKDYWRVSEVRAGREKWEDLEIIARAMRFDLPTGGCDAPELFTHAPKADPSVKRARCLIANLFGVTLPSDAVRIKEVSSMGLPLGSQPSALVVALVQLGVRLSKDGRDWHVADIRSGNRGWLNVEKVPAAVDQVKRNVAEEELNTVARALEAFRHDRGSFVISDKHAVLIDHLSPQYLVRVIRLDPWHNPYQYQGERDHFLLRSTGPDGKPNTVDDIIVTDRSR
jgi:hypothetical protein